MTRRWALAAPLMATLLVAVACGGSNGTSSGGSASPLPTSIGKGEGELDLVAWVGYVEDGSTDPNFDWVHPFEQQTGCQVHVKYGDTSDAMVNLMRQGGGTVYDGVSASGDATLRLIAHHDVAPVNVDLIPGWKDFLPTLQSPPHNTIKGVHYGVSYMYGANVLMYNTDAVPASDASSWKAVFDPGSPYAGKLTAYDSPIYIADAALYLKSHDPSLGIDDPYELTAPQLDAAVNLLKGQQPNIKKYWSVASDEIDLYTSGDVVAGTAWPYQVSILQSDKQPVASTIPTEGATGWADTWMLSAHAKHPNCMYQWMKWASTPDVQALVAEFYGATPSNQQSCAKITTDLGAAAAEPYKCGDDAFVHQLHLWKTPLADCGNGKTDCMDYSVWTQKWTEVTGA
jgi:putative spermidine/putrescine transport system substrate-binding protein